MGDMPRPFQNLSFAAVDLDDSDACRQLQETVLERYRLFPLASSVLREALPQPISRQSRKGYEQEPDEGELRTHCPGGDHQAGDLRGVQHELAELDRDEAYALGIPVGGHHEVA